MLIQKVIHQTVMKTVRGAQFELKCEGDAGVPLKSELSIAVHGLSLRDSSGSAALRAAQPPVVLPLRGSRLCNE